MIRLLIGSILAAAIGFAWGFVSWEVLKLHDGTYAEITDKDAAATIADLAKGDAVYMFPPLDTSIEDPAERQKAHSNAFTSGPYVFAIARSGPGGKSMTTMMAWEFATRLAGALVIGFLLISAKNLRYLGRAFFVGFAGLFAGIIVYIPLWNWFEFPIPFLRVMAIDLFVSWLLAGLVLAIFIRENKSEAA